MTKQHTNNDLLTRLEAIPVNKVIAPRVKIDRYIQEAFDLQVWMEGDHEALMAAGLSQALIEELPVRAELLVKAQTLWNNSRRSRSTVQEEWDQWEAEAKKFRSELKTAFKFAFRDHPELLSKVYRIGKRKSHAQLVQDLSDLSVLGAGHKDLLKSIGFDLTLLEQATQWSQDSARLLAKLNQARKEGNTEKVLRDKAYTYLKEAVDQIRHTGKFVFHHNPVKRREYAVSLR